jgi:hypothetical protein
MLHRHDYKHKELRKQFNFGVKILAENCQTPLKVSERQKLVLEIQNHKFTDLGNKHKFPYPTAQQQDPNIGHSA